MDASTLSNGRVKETLATLGSTGERPHTVGRPGVRAFVGESIGTFLLVLFGCGSVAVTVLFDAHQGLMQIALAWGFAVTLAVYATRHLSGAHLNPAVSVAMVASGRLRARRLPLYLLAQAAGAFAAAASLYALFGPSIASFEAAHGIVRGSPESVRTALMFGEYYGRPESVAHVSVWLACAAEALGTFILVGLILALTDPHNAGRPTDAMAPLFVGLTITSLICLIAPLTQGGFNPARDLMPRLFAWLAGWGDAAFPDRHFGFLTVYVVSPIVGGVCASILFGRLVAPAMQSVEATPAERNTL